MLPAVSADPMCGDDVEQEIPVASWLGLVAIVGCSAGTSVAGSIEAVAGGTTLATIRRCSAPSRRTGNRRMLSTRPQDAAVEHPAMPVTMADMTGARIILTSLNAGAPRGLTLPVAGAK